MLINSAINKLDESEEDGEGADRKVLFFATKSVVWYRENHLEDLLL